MVSKADLKIEADKLIVSLVRVHSVVVSTLSILGSIPNGAGTTV